MGATPPNATVRHVIMWRLKDRAEGATRAVNGHRLRTRLECLRRVLPGILDLEVGLNAERPPEGYDVVLTVTCAGRAALRALCEHAAYREVLAFAESLCEACHAADYERSRSASDQLRAAIQRPATLVMPDAYDALSAQLIERSGFEAVQCSGFSMALSAGLAYEQQLTLDDNLKVTGRIVQAVSHPVMADGEDGYGDPAEVGRTVCRFLEAGVAGINLEDQVLDGEPGVRVVDAGLMVAKLDSAREAAARFGNGRLVINARTDVLRAGPDRARQLRKAVQRAQRYLEAGADLVFVPYVETLHEAATLQREVAGPLSVAAGLSYNLDAFTVAELCELGIARVSLPTFAVCTAMQSMQRALQTLRETGRFGEPS